MISREKGNLPGSHYYFFNATDVAKKMYYYLIWCGHYYCNDNYSIKRNLYQYPLVVYVRKGKMNLKYRGKSYVATEGEIFLIDCLEPHHYYSTKGLEFSYFHFDGLNSHEYTRYLLEMNGSPIFRTSNNTEIGKIIMNTVQRYFNDENISEPELSGVVYDLMIKLAVKEKNEKDKNKITDKAINYIDQHLSEHLTLVKISKAVNLSEYYFSRVFKADTGFSPMEYVANMRMDLAISLLRTTDFPIDEVAFRVGYASGASFINAFSKRLGISPSKFRKLPI